MQPKRKTKILAPSHSFRLRPHRHTSYLSLATMLIVTGFILGAVTTMAIRASTGTAYAGGPHPGPQAGSIGLTGVMPGKPPTTAATISSPTNGSHFGKTPISISGTCPKNTVVQVFKNNIFAGSAVCSDTGTYSFNIDLMIGKNTLVARVYDALNQVGPDSNIVTVYYDALPAQNAPSVSFNFGGKQMLLNTTAVFRGIFPNQKLSVPIDIIGGTPPFAVNVLWGDAETTTVPRGNNDTFTVDHVYKKAGVYQISIQATDSQGLVAFLTVAAIVNGQPDPMTSAGSSTPTKNELLMLWPLLVAGLAVVASFWLGEQREKRALLKHGTMSRAQ